MASKKRHTLILIFSALALFVLIFFEPTYGWRVRELLSPLPSLLVSQNSQQGQTNSAEQALVAENEALQSQLAQIQGVFTQIPQNPQDEIRAMVYLQYPFGFKNELLVSAGSNEGVAVGKAVTFQGIFVGTVIQVFPASAVVQTVFDPSFKMPVRIGGGSDSGGSNSAGADALLVGGADPRATSIGKDADVESNDVIYTAAPGIPYGLPIGVVNATTTSADKLFQEVSLNFAYDIDNIQTVLIAR